MFMRLNYLEKWVDIVDSVEIQKEQSIEVYEKLEKINDTEVKKRKLKTYNCNKPWGICRFNYNG